MKLGTDVCLQTCKKEGYLIMDFKKRELFIKGEFQKDVNVRFFKHYPDYVLKDIYGTENPVGEVTIMMDIDLSAEDVWESYQQDKESIDSCAGLSHEFPTCEGSLLSLASDIEGYKGLE
jgi:hypothetical protein